MMKKTLLMMIAILLTLTLAAALAGCGSDKTDQAEGSASFEDNKSSVSALTPEDVIFTYNGTSVELNSNADEAVAGLGEAQDVSSQLSCHGEGDDKTYTYKDFVLNTYPLDGTDRVLEIVIKTAGIATSRGIQVGDSKSYVIDAYGSDYKEVGMYMSYDAGGGKSLQFFIQDDTVQEISYYYDV